MHKPLFDILNKGDIEQIHNASVQVLEKLGVRIEDREIREKLHGHGCHIENDRVRFNINLIEAMLNNVKRKITLTNMAGVNMDINEDSALSHASSELPFIIDLETGEKRDATFEDLKNSIKLMNRLKALDMTCALVYPSDIPPQINQIKQCEALLRYSEKPFFAPGGSSAKESQYIVELFNLIASKDVSLSSNNIGIVGISPESPLNYPQVIVDKMKIIISAGIPTDMLIAPIVGLSAPMTITGGLVQMNASMLAFATIAYLINPDTPIIYGSRLSFINMKTGNSIWGLPEVGITGACSAKMARHYGFLSDVYGFSTTACTFDSQAGYEKAINGLLPLISGANMLSGFGSLASILVASYEQLIIDNEMLSVLKKVAQGVSVNEDTLALEVIDNVIRGEGSYIMQKHTLRHLKNGEVFIPELGFDDLWNKWEQIGRKKISDNARKQAQQELQKDDSELLPSELINEMRTIINSAHSELVEKDY